MDILTQISKLSRRLMLVEAAAVAVIASIASGCNTDFLPDDEGQPMVVVNVVATPDRELTARVTRTWPHSQWPKPDVTLADASVAYTVNGRPCGLMTFNDSTKSFTAPYVPTEGDEIAIEVVSEQYGTAAGYTKVPRKVKIDHWSFTPVEFTDFNGIVDDGTSLSYLRRLDIRYSITFTDPAGEENYYMLTGRPYYEPGGGISTDPIISENDTPLEAVFSDRKTFIVFSDRNIDGRTYTFPTHAPTSRLSLSRNGPEGASPTVWPSVQYRAIIICIYCRSTRNMAISTAILKTLAYQNPRSSTAMSTPA